MKAAIFALAFCLISSSNSSLTWPCFVDASRVCALVSSRALLPPTENAACKPKTTSKVQNNVKRHKQCYEVAERALQSIVMHQRSAKKHVHSQLFVTRRTDGNQCKAITIHMRAHMLPFIMFQVLSQTGSVPALLLDCVVVDGKAQCDAACYVGSS
jgi:hypothetical protein